MHLNAMFPSRFQGKDYALLDFTPDIPRKLNDSQQRHIARIGNTVELLHQMPCDCPIRSSDNQIHRARRCARSENASTEAVKQRSPIEIVQVN